MTDRKLPHRPDMRRLRREARDLHARLQRQTALASFADAQFILAAEYGFKSWSQLRKEVDRRIEERWANRLAMQQDAHLMLGGGAEKVVTEVEWASEKKCG